MCWCLPWQSVCCCLICSKRQIRCIRNAHHGGYLPAGWCIAWGALCIPFLVAGAVSLKRKIAYQGRVKLLIALCAAFVFIISSLKIPSVTGSCSHATGTGLGAILFGPSIMSVLGIIVLLFQAILLAHGGLTTLGANTFSMAIFGPFVSYGLFRLLKKCKAPMGLAVFLSATIGDMATYCLTSVQLAAAYPGDNFWAPSESLSLSLHRLKSRLPLQKAF